ncbi:MarR family winged helix-turn-helix transcriptional regulator [Prauserella cavernicola]|uniref:MarR family transcriptional regulator n=1 Tax=Prauserella cavernicola TaxID=2800127 RepID=A0A934V8A4_9PSEU|nr:MarR family transcriptional regulator [Prauserella cavernicola]MBK1788095.1 MarR family transcriptional regulator [Prauserella cavernicola]
MPDTERTANLLGATALALTDLALGGATEAAKVSASGAAALVSLSAQPGLSVTELGRRVGLTQSAAARMVDSLEAAGLVERKPSPWQARMTMVEPTRAGRQAARKVLAARGGPLTDLVGALGEEDQKTLGRLLTTLLTRLYDEVGDAQYLCRLCDRKCCATGAMCPVGQAERDQR